MALFHNWESFNCNDAELGATLPHLCCFSILRRVEPAPCRLHAGELKNGHAARGVSVAFKQSISLAACQITRAIFWQNLKCQSAVLLLERLRSGGRGPFHNNESRTFFLLSGSRTPGVYGLRRLAGLDWCLVVPFAMFGALAGGVWVPAVALPGAVTEKCVAAAGLTVIVLLVPVIPLVTLSVAVTV